MGRALRLLRWILGAVAFLPVAGFCLLSLIVLVQNWGYADTVFADWARYDSVLASRRWHPVFGAEAADCTWAVVALSDGAVADPEPEGNSPGQRSDSENWWSGGGWSRTSQVRPEAFDLLEACEFRLEPELYLQMKNALLLPGGWMRTSVETLQVYSASTHIAYIVRFGD